jgi:hypothetical protein
MYYILNQKMKEVSIWSDILNQSITVFFVLITVYLLYGKAKDQINDGLNTIKKGVNQVKSIVS